MSTEVDYQPFVLAHQCVCRKLLRFFLYASRDHPAKPLAEIARAKFKLSQVLQDSEKSQEEVVKLRGEARDIIKTVYNWVGEEDREEDYDRCIAYFLR